MRYEDENIWLTQKMMATVQNKMHFAVHCHTAAELIAERDECYLG